jgi:hypothetical protein
MYGLCFRWVAVWLTSLLEASLGAEKFELNFRLESGHKNAGDVRRVFDQFKKDEKTSAMFRSLSFHEKETFCGLQGADYVAHTTWLVENRQNVETEHLTDFPAKASIKDARQILGRKSPVFRGHLSGSILQEIKSNIIAYDAKRLEFGRTRHKPSSAQTKTGTA